MCTVTYLPVKNGCLITSNRDEHIARPAALVPAIYKHGDVKIIYPKDAKANGTWIALTDTGNAAVLLNGAFVKHQSNPPYRKSRGLVLLDIIAAASPESTFLTMDLDKIEPFTVVLYVDGFLFEGRWDGQKKHFVQLNEKEKYIWSSATLYDTETIEKRRSWFSKWIEDHQELSVSAAFNFHRFAGDGDSTNDVLMNRNNQLLTVSITGIDISSGAATMHYYDIAANEHTITNIQHRGAPVFL